MLINATQVQKFQPYFEWNFINLPPTAVARLRHCNSHLMMAAQIKGHFIQVSWNYGPSNRPHKTCSSHQTSTTRALFSLMRYAIMLRWRKFLMWGNQNFLPVQSGASSHYCCSLVVHLLLHVYKTFINFLACLSFGERHSFDYFVLEAAYTKYFIYCTI